MANVPSTIVTHDVVCTMNNIRCLFWHGRIWFRNAKTHDMFLTKRNTIYDDVSKHAAFHY